MWAMRTAGWPTGGSRWSAPPDAGLIAHACGSSLRTNLARRPSSSADRHHAWTAELPSASQWITLQLSGEEWHRPTLLNNHALFCEPALDRLSIKAAQLQTTNPAAPVRRHHRRVARPTPGALTTLLAGPKVDRVNARLVPQRGAVLCRRKNRIISAEALGPWGSV